MPLLKVESNDNWGKCHHASLLYHLHSPGGVFKVLNYGEQGFSMRDTGRRKMTEFENHKRKSVKHAYHSL